MKFLIAVFFMFVCCNESNGQKAPYVKAKPSNDSIVKHNNLFIKLQSSNAYAIIVPSATRYHFGSMPGTGLGATVGFKLHEKIALGFGFQKMHFFLNQSSLENYLRKTYETKATSVQIISSASSSLSQQGLFVYASNWRQKGRNVLELFTKLHLSSFQYRLNTELMRSVDNSKIGFEGGISNNTFMMSAGLQYARQISKVLFVTGGLEYLLNFKSKTLLYEKNTYADQREEFSRVEFPAPSHMIALNIGLMCRPKKPCNCKSQKPW